MRSSGSQSDALRARRNVRMRDQTSFSEEPPSSEYSEAAVSSLPFFAHGDLPMQHEKTFRILATAAWGCFGLAAGGLLLMHVLRTDYPLASHMISDYAVGK